VIATGACADALSAERSTSVNTATPHLVIVLPYQWLESELTTASESSEARDPGIQDPDLVVLFDAVGGAVPGCSRGLSESPGDGYDPDGHRDEPHKATEGTAPATLGVAIARPHGSCESGATEHLMAPARRRAGLHRQAWAT